MSHKSQFSIDEVLQSLVDEYQITNPIICEEDVVSPYLVEWNYFKTFGSLKGVAILHQFFIKNIFSNCDYMKDNFEK